MAVTPGILANGILPSFTDDLYTATTYAYLTGIVATNVGAGTRTVNFAVYDTNEQVDIPLSPYNLQLLTGETLYVDVRAALRAGDKFRGDADNNTDVKYVFFGGEDL